MIKFIIVEDDEKYIEEYKRIINDVLFKSDKEYDIYSFTNYTKELKDIISDNSEQKVYLMDLELDPKHDGMTILREIREDDWDSEIIVLTNHDRMFETVHKEIYKTFDFIEKFDDMEKRLRKDLNKIIKKKYDNKKFLFSNKRISLQIYLKDIVYIYRDTVERKLIIKTSNNEFIANLSIQDILKMLDSRFTRCSKSCIINEDRIVEKNYNEGYFITDTGDQEYMLSKKYRSEV